MTLRFLLRSIAACGVALRDECSKLGKVRGDVPGEDPRWAGTCCTRDLATLQTVPVSRSTRLRQRIQATKPAALACASMSSNRWASMNGAHCPYFSSGLALLRSTTCQ
jgi:hypothetical protein